MRMISASFVLDDRPDLDDFNHWYSTRHVSDFLRAPGVVSGRRFYRRIGDKYHFMTLYEHDGCVPVRETFASPAGRYAVEDFEKSWPSIGMPRIEVFIEIPVGPGYQTWRLGLGGNEQDVPLG